MSPQTGLSLADHRAMMNGFIALGYRFSERPNYAANPMVIRWETDSGVKRFRLWAFLITGGGGGPTVRAADEFRIQITNGPDTAADLDKDGAIDLVVGYVPSKDVIVAYDRRWMEGWIGSGGGSPSIQVKEADIDAANTEGFRRLTKPTKNFENGRIVTMKSALLPAYLTDANEILMGSVDVTAAQSIPSAPGSSMSLKQYCEQRGFFFSSELLARYVAGLLTKPFVILAGVSGTGKSKLAELTAEFYTSAPTPGPQGGEVPPGTGDAYVIVPQRGPADPNRFGLIPVRPDWIDNQSVLGFVNPITSTYESTAALDLILRANQAFQAAPDKPAADRYFMLLDEMNLAKVEHYFSDWLACTESRRLEPNGAIRQQSVPLHRTAAMTTTLASTSGATTVIDVPQQLQLPTNLIVTGTVNVDETTYGFSPKVLDRAMVIEFDEVNLDSLRLAGTAQSSDSEGYRLPEYLPPFRLANSSDYSNLPSETHSHLVALNSILEEARLHFGYRSANEIALFISIYNNILPVDESDPSMLRALDIAVLQKVLPKLQGNRSKIERPLGRFCSYLRDLQVPPQDAVFVENDTPALLPNSFVRAVEMLDAVKDFGFVSFFK